MQSKNFKVGDQVICVDIGGNFYITKGKEYRVNGIDDADGSIRVTDDDGDEAYYSSKLFTLNSEDFLTLFNRAQSLVGRTFKYNSSPAVNRKCDRVRVYLHKDEFKDGRGSVNSRAMFDKLGFAIVVGNETSEFDIREVQGGPLFKEIPISNEYTAEVYGDKVVVGCQTVSKEKLEELLQAMNEISGN